jgi:D-beta-D-heptose 7-phosphate kinase/D-beta-D-heptose 1-phosphate adenosyltransferase
MAALEAADLVVLFDEETPLEIVNALLPDVIIKGADYAPDDVVGAADVIANGGRLVLVPLEVGHSTTGTIARINAEN